MKTTYSRYIILVCILAYAHCACVYDFQCGTIPYNECKGGADECAELARGLAVDRQSNKLYFSQSCRSDFGDRNLTIKAVSASGGPVSDLHSQPYSFRFNNIYQIHEVAGDAVYFSTSTPQPGIQLRILKLSTSQITSFTPGHGLYSSYGLDIDTQARQSFSCSIDRSYSSTFDRYDGILGQESVVRQPLYAFAPTHRCTAVKAQSQSDNLYMTTVEYAYPSTVSNFFKGSKNCIACANPPDLLFQLINETISDFVVVNNKIYFITEKGGYYSDLNGENKVTVWHTQIWGIETNGNKIFWNTHFDIISTNLDGSNKQNINKESGLCECATGFSGEDCMQCSGQIQWYQGTPSCVELGSDGFPVQCRESYQCGNQPFSYCSSYYGHLGTCECRHGLTGAPACDHCEDPSQSIVWNNGYPSCQ